MPFDNNTSATFSANVSTAFTVGSNSNRVLLCARISISSIVPTPTYNGVSFTQILSVQTTGSGLWLQIWILQNPATGSNTFALVHEGSNPECYFLYSYYDVFLHTQPDNSSSTTSTGTTTDSLTPNTNNCLLWGVQLSNDNGSPTPSGLSNNMLSTVAFFSGNTTAYAGDNGQVGAGSQSASIACGVGNRGLVALVTIAPEQTITGAMSDSIFRGASRATTLSQAFIGIRTMSDSIFRGAGRTTTLIKGLLRTMSDSIMNAAGRFVVLLGLGGIWKNTHKDTTVFTNSAHHSSSWANKSKDASTFTNESKSTPS